MTVLTRVRSGRDLLRVEAARRARLARLAGLPEPYFQRLYTPVLEAAAAYAQALPLADPPGGALLPWLLDRAIQALARRQGHWLPPDADPGVVAAASDVWTYAVFTAALLGGLAPLTTGPTITLYAATGRRRGLWEPWRGPLTTPGSGWYASAGSIDPTDPTGRRFIPWLIPPCLPAVGIAWLWRDPALRRAWWDALRGGAPAGPLDLILACQPEGDPHA